MGQHAEISRYVPNSIPDSRSAVADIIAAALSCFLVLILVGLEFTAIAGRKKQKAAENAQPQSWDRLPPNHTPQSQNPFEATSERTQ